MGRIEDVYIPRIRETIRRGGYIYGTPKFLAEVLGIPSRSLGKTLKKLVENGEFRVEHIGRKIIIFKNGYP